MIGEKILNVLAPESEQDWFLLETDKEFYSLRLGGIVVESKIDKYKYRSIEISVIGKPISSIYTDDFIVLIETADGSGFEHTPNGGVTGDGETYFAIFDLSKEQLSEVISSYNQSEVELRKIEVSL
jgi:hypothetical protein